MAEAPLSPSAREKFRRWRFESSLRPTDVFLVGHPKSGNTWLAYMLAIALFRDREGRVTLGNVGNYVPFVHARDERIAEYESLPNPRVFRNEILMFEQRYPRVIYLLRDPRAVLVSFWHMYRVMFDDTWISLRSFVEQYLSMRGCFTQWNKGLVRWDRQVEDWIDRSAHDDRVTMVRYEDLVRDREATLQRLLGFLAVSRETTDLSLAIERGGFEAMRKMEDQHGAEAYREAPGEGKFVRIGELASWQHEMEPGLASQVEAEFSDAMKLAGYLGVRTGSGAS